ncbi:MAG: C4-dicarboxylate ABC transporter substrate-binding protein, partial [Ruminococcaceae bacterium]|nr:C4-dicarboxylate ABC transporter substrate-binding protein [Oscillospiraceae bacterium]
MKRMISIALALVMLLALTACGGSADTKGAAGTKMTMGTGGTSGTYYGYGGVLGQYIKNNAGINVTVVS